MLVDSHCHLDFPDFADELPEIIARAESVGIGRMVTICTRVAKFPQVLAVAERFENVFCSVGTHPHNSHEELNVTAEKLLSLAEHPKVVAIGEAGLDYFYQKDHAAAQAQSLRVHIDAARRSGLPLVIHSRDADEDMANILEDEAGKGSYPALLHCFSSGMELMKRGVALGLYVSFSGILTFKRSEELREIAKQTPMDRLLVETDAPYLAPLPFRGKRNEPSYVAHTCAMLAEVKGVSDAEMRAITSENFFRLFSKVPNPNDEKVHG